MKRCVQSAMKVQMRQKRHFYLASLHIVVSAVCITVGIESQTTQVAAQSQSLRESVCLGIIATAPEPKLQQNVCCQQGKRAKCLSWRRLFPPVPKAALPTLSRPKSDIYTPRLDEYGNNIASPNAAKDAVIQLGVTKALNAIAPRLDLDSKTPNAGTNRSTNLFQRAAKTYQQILGPKLLKSGAILTPQIEMNMSVGDISVDSLKLGVGVQF